MTKSELIERLATQQSHIPAKTVEDAVKEMLEHMASTLAQGERINIANVAARSGFNSISSFNRYFYKIKEMTPTDYLHLRFIDKRS